MRCCPQYSPQCRWKSKKKPRRKGQLHTAKTDTDTDSFMSKGDMASVEKNKHSVGSLNIKERGICLREGEECELWLAASVVLSVYMMWPKSYVSLSFGLFINGIASLSVIQIHMSALIQMDHIFWTLYSS